ncbi:MAG TPA: C25 family cysteine peptidase, partial [Candidatus Cloacimonadota bacterium]|nr:C25 family cysteine peptidase [Candidatus Cloacimonadota bacterium]
DKVRVEITYDGADYAATEYMRAKTYSPAFEPVMKQNILNYTDITYGRDALTRHPMKYVIISDPMFSGQLDPFIEWKTEQGYQVIVKYKGEAEVGTTKESIKAYLQNLWNIATPEDPAPTYLLFVGDHAQIPAWSAQASPTGHITDLTYVRLEGPDFMPEMYYGRFSANNASELQPQIDKTLYYEKYEMDDPSYLANQILIAGMDSNFGNSHGNGQINYVLTHYATAENGITPFAHMYPNSGSQASQIVSEASNGVGWITYTAHGDWNLWYDPSFSISNINSLQNAGKYAFVVGNCCLTNKFEQTTCFGEAWLRAANKGAISYIGGTNSTYWNEDYWFSVGMKGSANGQAAAYNSMQLGMFDQLYHTHGEAYLNWSVSAMAMIHAGNMAVQSSSSTIKNYYWEIYSVMGDPSLSPYLRVGLENPAEFLSTISIGMPTYTVTGAAPYSYVALSFNGELKGVALCDEYGDAFFDIAGISEPGVAKLVITAQNHVPVIANIEVIPSEGAYVIYNAAIIEGTGDNSIDYNTTENLSLALNNVGSESAQNLSVLLRSNSPYITIIDSLVSFEGIGANEIITLENAFTISAAENAPNGELASMQVEIEDEQGHIWSSNFRLTLNAPVIEIGTFVVNDSNGNDNGRLDPGEAATVIIPIENKGRAASVAGQIIAASSTNYLTIENDINQIETIAANDTYYLELQVAAADNTPSGTAAKIGLLTEFGNVIAQTSQELSIGLEIESFESGDFSSYPWTQGNIAWSVVNNDGYDGSHSAKSGTTPNNSNSSMSLNHTAQTNGTISFYYKVSSEANYDKLNFYIDGVRKASWSGQVPWTNAQYTVTAGQHEYKWEYAKDYSTVGGSDCAWVDYIVFPNEAGGGSGNTAFAYMNTDPIEFGDVEINTSAEHNLRVVNFGQLMLVGQLSITGDFSSSIYTFSVSPDGYMEIPVTFAPTEEGDFTGELTITTNDPAHYSFNIALSGTSIPSSNDIVIPLVTKLENNYPNPFNPETNIAFSLSEKGAVNIDIYNIKGQLVKHLVNEIMPAGRHSIMWNGRDDNNKSVSSGVYFYRMQSKSYAGTKKMLLMK